MNQGLSVDFDPKRSRFVITGAPWLVDLVRGLPNRRWDSKRREWTAPAIRANAAYIQQNLRPPQAHLTDAAEAIVAERVVGKSKPVREGFPAHAYKFKTQPYDHQRKALDLAYGLSSFALFMAMRTGKTKVAVDLHGAYTSSDQSGGSLILCPKSVREVWRREFAAHCPVPYDLHMLDTGSPEKLSKWMNHNLKTNGPGRVLVASVESLQAGRGAKLCEEFLMCTRKPSIFLDEASMIRNHDAIRTKAAIDLAKLAAVRVPMTGTPIARGPMNLYAIFEFMDPDIIGIGDFYSFRNRYAVMGGYPDPRTGKPTQIIGYANLPELFEIVAPYVYQVKLEDVFDMPPTVRPPPRTVEISAAQKKLYNDMRRNKSTSHNDLQLVAKNTLEVMLRLQQISGGFVTTEREPTALERLALKDSKDKRFFQSHRIEEETPKLRDLMQLLEETDATTVIWCAYRSELEMVRKALADKYGAEQVLEIHGGVDEQERGRLIYDVFQKGKARFLVANQGVGAMGQDMTAASVEVFYSNTFNFIDREQAQERLRGPKQTKSVLIVDLITKGSADETVLAALLERKDVAEYVSEQIRKRGPQAVDELLGGE